MIKDLPPKKAVFLDRDGTLNQDAGYVHTVAAWVWLPTVLQAIALLHEEGWFLVVVSNQSGIARGYFGADALGILENHIQATLSLCQSRIDAFYYCPHLPEITGPCSCRKPAPGMLLQAAREHAIDLTQSWMIGDRLHDMQAGLAAHTRCIKLAGDPREDSASEALGCTVVQTLLEAARIITAQQLLPPSSETALKPAKT